VVLAEDQLLVLQRPPEYGDRVLEPPGRAVGGGEVAAGGERVGMVGPEDPLPAGQSSLEVRKGLAEPANRQAHASELAARGQRLGVARPHRFLALRERIGQHVDGEVDPGSARRWIPGRC
jgi:hypothetical protein